MTTACILVSHTHWDREWYRPFEAFRARLVDTVDAVLDQLEADPGWSFVLDGQTVVLEDYLEIRPARRAELEQACRAGRIAIGPWYVQPDSLLPSGEAHVRNLLEGRRVGQEIGPVSTVGYTPDSFGHPAQLPQILAGFGISSFVYWRGNGAEIDDLPPVWRWEAPDGSTVLACLLAEGYFAAAYLGDDPERAATRLEGLVTKLAHPAVAEVLLMNGIDHAPPDTHTGAVVDALAARTGWTVRRGLLDDHVAALAVPRDASYTGELVGGRIANLLPGVWSTRGYLKQHNRAAETELCGWTEPFVALAGPGLSEDAAIRLAWRTLLVNQAHDSICGCSTDVVHEQMVSRYTSVIGLARETTARTLERLAGLGPTRYTAWDDGMDVAVWNPSPHPRTDVVRMALDAHPLFMIGSPDDEIHPTVLASMIHQGMTVDGAPARVVESDDDGRVRLTPDQRPWDVEWVAADVPAFGWRRYRLAPGAAAPSDEDDGRHIEIGAIRVAAADDGTLAVTIDDRTWSGFATVEDCGDRGDSYDTDVVDGGVVSPVDVEVRRRRHVNGIVELEVRRRFEVPAALDADRAARSAATTTIPLTMTARLVPGVRRVDLEVTLDNTARDHRMRLLFPTGGSEALAATTFDVARRRRAKPDDRGWMQPAPSTFAAQGWVAAGGCTIGAPDLREAAFEDGVVAFTLVRSVGWISQMDLRSRPIPAGPGMPAPGAQCLGRFTTRLSIVPGTAPVDTWDAELGLRAVAAGSDPVVPPDHAVLTLRPSSLVLSALKPGPPLVVRVLNLSDAPTDATLELASAVARADMLRLDETPTGEAAAVDGRTVTFPVGPHQLATVAVS